MTSARPLAFEGEVARADGFEWLLECRRLESAGDGIERRSPDGESFLLVLAGTHDIRAASGSWVRRGVRAEPTGGRPLGIFLPPDTPYRLENGTGRALVWSVRQPRLPELESPTESLSRKPLLEMAGSGKAFDPATGTWKPKEAFLTSAEAILPRRIRRIEHDTVTIERILDENYKALGLMLDEAVLDEGRSMEGLEPGRPAAEIGIYFECEGELAIGPTRVTGTGAVALRGGTVPRLEATRGRAYVAVAYACSAPSA